jgi:hypothetical protein
LKTNQRYSSKHQIIKGIFREIQISFKTSSASKEALVLSLSLSSSKEALVLSLSLSSSKEALSKSSQTSFIYA